MKLMGLLFFGAWLVLSFGDHHEEVESNRQPGIIFRWNKIGLDHNYELVLEQLKEKILNKELPSLERDNYLITFNITAVDLGSNNFDLSPPNSITHTTKNANIQVAASWIYFSDGQPHAGVTDFSINGITVKKQMLFNFGDNIHKLLLPGECDFEIGKIEFDINSEDPVVELTLDIFAEKAKASFEKQACDEITEELEMFVTHAAGMRESNHPVTDFFPESDNDRYIFETSSVTAPKIEQNGLTFFVDGSVYNTEENPSQELPFEASPAPSLGPSRQMFQVLLTEYFFDSLNYARWQDGLLDVDYPLELIDKYFNVDLTPSSLAEEYPIFEPYVNSSIHYRLIAVESPRSKINESGIFTRARIHVRVIGEIEDGRNETIFEYNFNEIQWSQLYVWKDAVYKRLIEMRWDIEGEGPQQALAMNRMMEGNADNILHLNYRLSQNPYLAPSFYEFDLESITIKMMEGGVDFAGEIGLKPKGKYSPHRSEHTKRTNL